MSLVHVSLQTSRNCTIMSFVRTGSAFFEWMNASVTLASSYLKFKGQLSGITLKTCLQLPFVKQSFATAENTLFTPAGKHVFQGCEAFFQRAADAGVTILAAAGDKSEKRDI